MLKIRFTSLTENPIIKIAEELSAKTLNTGCADSIETLVDNIKNSVLNSLPKDFDVESVVLAEDFGLLKDNQEFTAKVNIRFGYTFKEVKGNETGKVTEDTIKVTYVYTKDPRNELVLLNPNDFMANLMGSSSSMMGAGITIFGELINDDAMVKEQYEMIEGRWPTKFDELMVVLPDIAYTISVGI